MKQQRLQTMKTLAKSMKKTTKHENNQNMNKILKQVVKHINNRNISKNMKTIKHEKHQKPKPKHEQQ